MRITSRVMPMQIPQPRLIRSNSSLCGPEESLKVAGRVAHVSLGTATAEARDVPERVPVERTGTPHGFRGSLAGCRGATRIPALAHKHAEPRRRRRPRSRTRARRPRLRPHPLASTRQRLRRRPRLENAHDSTVLPSLLCSFRSRYHRGRAVGAFASLDPVGLLQLSYVASDVCQLRGRHLRLRRHVSE